MKKNIELWSLRQLFPSCWRKGMDNMMTFYLLNGLDTGIASKEMWRFQITLEQPSLICSVPQNVQNYISHSDREFWKKNFQKATKFWKIVCRNEISVYQSPGKNSSSYFQNGSPFFFSCTWKYKSNVGIAISSKGSKSVVFRKQNPILLWSHSKYQEGN